ncbi:MAG: cytochrome c [Chloroflexi bacterium]|nr:cytochrome c [Chloroflexota bacterium]
MAKKLFVGTCLACHGEGGKGIEGLGKDMTTSEFIKGLSDAELLEFIKVGRSSTDPANTTGVDMPLRGGNPALTDDDIADIIAYMRTLEKIAPYRRLTAVIKRPVYWSSD